MKEILIIIDMQEIFETAHKRATINSCKQLIKEFKRNKRGIIVLEYNGEYYGKTLPCLTKLLEGYSRGIILKKRGDDGSSCLARYFKRMGLGKDKLKLVICGVNSECCVKETVEGLLEKDFRVAVVRAACNGYRKGWCGNWHGNGWHEKHLNIRPQKIKNLTLV